MRIVMFYHSLLSDWNHGNAHFLRGVVSELLSRGHEVQVYEPVDSWSLMNLLRERGTEPISLFRRAYPMLHSIRYNLRTLALQRALEGSDLVLVHEWNDPELVGRIGQCRARGGGYRLLFHDTHHRSVTDGRAMANYDLSSYDGVLAFGEVVRRLYLQRQWTRRAWTWHEAADTRVFRPIPRVVQPAEEEGDLVWIGNWGDEERSAELHEFLVQPVRSLGLRARVHGVRYPEAARAALQQAGIDYGGWLANYQVPEAFGRFRMTLHVPRRPYVEALPGIPTIRPFEALACGIPLICSPWQDSEGLFRPGKDFLVARDGREMRSCIKAIREDRRLAEELAANGLETIRNRHTCAHRVNELLSICGELGIDEQRLYEPQASRTQRLSG